MTSDGVADVHGHASTDTAANVEILHLHEATFESMTSSGVVVVDFFADWCHPCVAQDAVLREIVAEHPALARVTAVDIKSESDLATRLGVSSVPTLFLMKDGKIVKRLSGLRRKRQLIDELLELVAG